jgi:hypothetical protein
VSPIFRCIDYRPRATTEYAGEKRDNRGHARRIHTAMTPNEPPEPPRTKRLNSFQLLSGILSAAAGVRGNSARSKGFANASTGAIIGALLIFCSVAFIGCYAFIHAIKSAVAPQ